MDLPRAGGVALCPAPGARVSWPPEVQGAGGEMLSPSPDFVQKRPRQGKWAAGDPLQPASPVPFLPPASARATYWNILI